MVASYDFEGFFFFYSFLISKNLLFFYIDYFVAFLIFSCHIYSLIYTNLLYLPLTLLFYSFFLFFFSPCLSVCFAFIALFPSWHTALALFSSLCFNQFCFYLVDIIFAFLCLQAQSLLLYFFLFFGLFWFCLYMCVYIYSIIFVSICLILYLPIVWGLHFVSCFNLL